MSNASENKPKLIKLLFVIHSSSKGKRILLDIPEVDKLSSHNSNKAHIRNTSYSENETFNDLIVNQIKEKEDTDISHMNDLLTEIFSLKNLRKNQHILDIQIGDYR